MRKNLVSLIAGAVLCAAALPALSEEVGQVGVDWLGNDIIVEAITDPKIEGVTCHISYFDRGLKARRSSMKAFRLSGNSASSTAFTTRRTTR